ncbi:3-hydroxyacyl-CoA dehydrogenase NAD-binding domain-containing protein [Opitutus sp. ER46]|uniref:3-hydroxyacyl-CoA dehydrogenase NAD-binding domain-containing protein n=1 Tax=Opitutus sp. ER46 TaxID=2161864 RepID=UPI000D310D4D|nr:3-hydroxyacyl-CoA dehydrogenase NAD-binding domain-containing protein [Opitutus sp. ER46]PTX96429.1 hypothetical protein DB354_07130 [Opitutus sp. ER46]
MAAALPVRFTVDRDGVGWIVFDAPGARANVCNAALLQAFAAVLDAAEASAAVALVLVSAKERVFLAGADLRVLQNLPDAATAAAFSRHGQQLLERLARSRVPVVAAIHGACPGGGLEVALACGWRIASDAPETRIGFPETSIGTIPGWGGSVRLPRLIGAKAALAHILRGQLLPAREALAAGLIDECVPAADLRRHAQLTALRLAADGLPKRPTPPPPEPTLWADTRRELAVRCGGRPYAVLHAVDVVQHTAGLSLPGAFAIEAERFGEATAQADCRNMIHAFLLREAARKRTLDGWFTDQPCAEVGPPVRRVGVVGAGVMGAGIAHWLATRGFDVVLRDVQLEFVERALGVIRGLIDDGVKRGQATPQDGRIVYGRIRTTTTWEGLADCDLVIEAIVESVEAKQRLFAELAAIVRPDTLLASNTSALPIDELAASVAGRHRLLGIHFFNPVSRMALVELVMGTRTSPESAARALEFVRLLGKAPVICRSSPGFLMTRVLFFYLNAAVRVWEQGVDAGAIDRALRNFGWPMGPLRLIDEVGIDVTAFIFGELAHYFPRRFTATTACDRLLAAGLKGRKNGSGEGFYRYDGRREAVNPKAAALGRTTADSAKPLPPLQPQEDAIVQALMKVMVEEARRCLAERVVLSADDVDFALLAGAGFPAFRGGLLHWAEEEMAEC